jgi:hypothetical protein
MRSLRPNDPWSIAAVLCLAGGGVLLLIAWYDISGTANLYQQMPYLVSAGFTGLALIIVGSALLVAGRSDRVERRLAQLLDAITEAVENEGGNPELAPAPEAPAGAAASTADPLVAASEGYLTVPEGTTYHRPGCLLLRAKDAGPADREAISDGRLHPCPVCLPEQQSESS